MRMQCPRRAGPRDGARWQRIAGGRQPSASGPGGGSRRTGRCHALVPRRAGRLRGRWWCRRPGRDRPATAAGRSRGTSGRASQARCLHVEDDVPLSGQGRRQRHLASIEVTGRQLRERHPGHYLRVRRDAAGRSPAPVRRADGDLVTARVTAGAGGRRGSPPGSRLRSRRGRGSRALEGRLEPEQAHGVTDGDGLGAWWPTSV